MMPKKTHVFLPPIRDEGFLFSPRAWLKQAIGGCLQAKTIASSTIALYHFANTLQMTLKINYQKRSSSQFQEGKARSRHLPSLP